MRNAIIFVGYLLECREVGSEHWKQGTQVKDFEGTISRLSTGKDYNFRVKAINENGLGDPQELMQAVTVKDEVYRSYTCYTIFILFDF